MELQGTVLEVRALG